MNVLTPVACAESTTPPTVVDVGAGGYENYMSDESRRTGTADALVFARSTAEVCAAVRHARDRDLSITVSGARTGIAAGAVPEGGMVISMERMNRVLGVRAVENDGFVVRCEAGVLLADLQRGVLTGVFGDTGSWDEESRSALDLLKKGHHCYPPDPTETGAAIGGTVACNASGAHTFRYGPTRPYVQGLTVVLSDGRRLELDRGQFKASGDGEFGLARPDGSIANGRVPTYPWPKTKNSAGYFAGGGMDLIDLFIGSEGTLGVITEVSLRVIAAPEMNCAVVTFWATEEAALKFTGLLRKCREEFGVEAIEYVGPNALDLLRGHRRALGPVSGVPECLPPSAACAVYVDLGVSEEAFEDSLGGLSRLAQDVGADLEHCWSAVERDERERLRIFRHALPETVNAKIAEARRHYPGLTKLGTDMAVPHNRLADVLRLYRRRLGQSDLQYVIFGHIGDSHLHVNILPRTPDEYEEGRTIYYEFAREVVAMGGSPAAEHGIGKLKTGFLKILFGETGVDQMLAVKRIFDPTMVLGKGTLFE